MKNSAWYHKLWREKFSNIPVKESSDSAWSGMKNLLDQHMPINVPVSGSPNVSFGTKLFKLISYVLPVVATISVITYVNLPVKKENQLAKEKKKSTPLDSINNEDINVEDFKGAKSVRHMDTSRIAYSKDNDKNVRDSNDVRDNSSISNKRSYDHKKFQLSKSAKSSKTDNIDGSLTMVSKFPQIKTAQIINNSTSSKRLNKGLRKMQKNVDGSLSGYLIRKLSPNRFSVRDTLISIQSPSIVIPKLLEPTVFVSLEKRRKDLQKKENETEKRKAKNNKNTNIRKFKKVKSDNIKLTRNNRIKSGLPNKLTVPPYNYGIEAGTNLGSYGSSLYAGIFGKFALKNKWLISIGFNANSNQNISGEFAHPSYFRPDSLPPFIISDARKLIILDIPLKLEYSLSKTITLNAGTIISFPIKQSSIETKLRPITDPRDTIYHSKEINSALSNTTVNRINIGFTGGISIHVRRFDINGSYQWFNPYRVKNPLGSYDHKNRFFRIGIGYRFK